MADYEEDADVEDRDERKESKTLEYQETADLEKVTDYAEEKEIGSVNLNNLAAINLIEEQRSKQIQAREEELAKVTITREDVELLIKELEITKQQAELALRQSSGDVVQAFVRLLS